MCYLDKICLLFGYVYYLVIFHNEDIWVRSSGPVVSPTKAPMGAKNSGQIRCGKKTCGPTCFFFGGGWGGGESTLKHTSIYKVSQGSKNQTY